MNFANFDFVLYVLLDENLLPSCIWKIRKRDIVQTENKGEWSEIYNGRVSFLKAIQNNTAERVF